MPLQKMGKDADALSEFKQAVELLPKNARVRYEYGKLLRRLGQTRSAKEQLELDANLRDTWYALSRLYPSLGQSNMAPRAA
jgi:Tfp pilus assembly protein PilF